MICDGEALIRVVKLDTRCRNSGDIAIPTFVGSLPVSGRKQSQILYVILSPAIAGSKDERFDARLRIVTSSFDIYLIMNNEHRILNLPAQ